MKSLHLTTSLFAIPNSSLDQMHGESWRRLAECYSLGRQYKPSLHNHAKLASAMNSKRLFHPLAVDASPQSQVQKATRYTQTNLYLLAGRGSQNSFQVCSRA